MAQNGTEKSLTAKQLRAVVLLAEDSLSDEEISKELQIGRRTLSRWKTLPEFIDAISEHVAELERRMMRLSIARRRYRVGRLDELESKLWEVIAERANDDEVKDAPGGSTGLIVKDIKSIGVGQSAQTVEVFGVDTGIIREIRALHEQAAKELGQHTEKINVSGSLRREYVIVTPDDSSATEEP